jgi:hypothetical protein
MGGREASKSSRCLQAPSCWCASPVMHGHECVAPSACSLFACLGLLNATDQLPTFPRRLWMSLQHFRQMRGRRGLQEEIILTGKPPEGLQLKGSASIHGVSFSLYRTPDVDAATEPFPTVEEASPQKEFDFALVPAIPDADSDDDMAYEVSKPTPSMPAQTSVEAYVPPGSHTRLSGPVAEAKDGDLLLMSPLPQPQSVFTEPDKKVGQSRGHADSSKPERLDATSHQNLFKSGQIGDSGPACTSQPLAFDQSKKTSGHTRSSALLTRQRTVRPKEDRNGRMRYHAGRPNLEAIFQEVEDEAEALGESRVALLVCGNKGVLESCLCIARTRKGRLHFDPHHEAFGF